MEAAAAGMAGNAYNMVFQWLMNKKNMEWQEKMYGVQRQDAREDRQHMEQYNDPKSMMSRLKAAGLNPNLIFGDASALTPAPVTRGADVPTPATSAPSMDIGAIVNPLLKQQEIDMMKELNDVRIENIRANSIKTMADIKGVDLDNKLLQESMNDLLAKRKYEALEQQTSYYLREIQEDLTQTQVNILKKELENKDYKIQLENAKSEAETKKIKTDIVLNYARTLREMAQAAATETQARKMMHEADRVEKLARYTEIDMAIKALGIIF